MLATLPHPTSPISPRRGHAPARRGGQPRGLRRLRVRLRARPRRRRGLHRPGPLIALPGWLPLALLGTANARDALSGKLMGMAWISGFAALFLAITGLTSTLDMPALQSVLWPTGSGLIVGLIYIGEGAIRRDGLHYALGTRLALTSTAALLLDTPGPFWVPTVAGGGAYVLATILERNRLIAAARS